MDALSREELVWVRCFAFGKILSLFGTLEHVPESVEEERQIVMIIELFNFNFPGYSVSFCVMFQCDREIAALVKLAEGGGAALALLEGPGQGRPDDRGIAHVRLEATFKH